MNMGISNLRRGSNRSADNDHDMTEARPDKVKGPTKTVARKDKKLQKKVQFYISVKERVASLNAKKEIQKKKRLQRRQKKLKAYDLSSLSEFLPDVHASAQVTDTSESKLTSKKLQKLVEKESKQFKAVITHPAFQADPLSAIHLHLLKTQPLEPVANNQEGKTGKKGKRKGKKGTSHRSQLMELH